MHIFMYAAPFSSRFNDCGCARCTRICVAAACADVPSLRLRSGVKNERRGFLFFLHGRWPL